MKLSNIFLNEKFIISVILANTIIIFIQEFGIDNTTLDICDVSCTLIFIVEMFFKHKKLGAKNYWKSPLNAMDGVLVIVTMPSLLTFFMPELANLSFLLVLRIFRIFRFFGLVRFFPYFNTIAHNFRLAIKQSRAILLIFLILIVTFALISCSLFKDVAPEYFATPLDAIYSTFRLFTVEGWYDMPDQVAVALGGSPIWAHLVRLYFCSLLIIGGIIGMSLINSIFVDAMVSDNNDDLKEQLARVEAKLDKLLAEQNAQNTLSQNNLSADPVSTDANKLTEQ